MLIWMALALAQDTPSPVSEAPSEDVQPPSDVPATADTPAAAPPAVVHTLQPAGALPSALSTPEAEAVDTRLDLSAIARATGLDLDTMGPSLLIHGSWFVRPEYTVEQLVGPLTRGPAALRLGVSAGRRYATIQQLPVQAWAAFGLRASAPFFGARGHRLEAFLEGGPWLGPVQLQVGFRARQERERWRRRTLELVADVLLGPELGFAVDAGPLTIGGSIHPLFALGDRPDARSASPVLPVLGDETVYAAHLGIRPGVFGLRGQFGWRETAIGGLFDVGVSVTFDPGAL
jgi:hypothetical protein